MWYKFTLDTMKKPFWKKDDTFTFRANILLEKVGYNGKRVLVYWNPRMRTTAGLAYIGKHLVVLNPKFQNQPDLETTLKHELAHILSWYRSSNRIPAHGPEWRQACSDLGIPNETRCHDFPVKRAVMTRKFFYQCPGCKVVIPRVRKYKKRIACLKCCKTHNNGKYHSDYRFRQILSPTVQLEKLAA